MTAPAVLCPHCGVRLSLVAPPMDDQTILCHADDQGATWPPHWLVTFDAVGTRVSGVGLAP